MYTDKDIDSVITELQEAAEWIEGVASKPYDDHIVEMVKGLDDATEIIRGLKNKREGI
jgi:hypothetical protein